MKLLKYIDIDVSIPEDLTGPRSIEKVPEKYDSQSPERDLKLAAMATVTIGIDSNEAEAAFLRSS